MALTDSDLRMVDLLRRRGLKYPRITIEETRRVGLPLSYALAFLEKESSGRDTDGVNRFGLNLFGNDPNANPVRGGFVSEGRYRDYLRNRRDGRGMQGVGPLQLTWWEFQDMADRLGGCWVPRFNMRVGFGIAKNLIRTHGKLGGAARWNGAGDAAAAYAADWIQRQDRWHDLLVDPKRPAQPGGRSLSLVSPHLTGEDVRLLQSALNQRLRALHLSAIDTDGDYGTDTDNALRQVAWLLGLGDGPIHGPVPPYVQRLVEHPGRRSAVQIQTAEKRVAQFQRGGGARARTLRWCRQQVGVHESPAGSNRGPLVSRWERDFGMDGQPWCGAFVGFALRHVAGIPVPNGIVYTPNIANYARAGTGGFASLDKWADRKPGDLVLFKFPGVSRDPVDHVGILDSDREHTIEGNTSTGDGSQNNGGIVARRNRGGANVVGCARPRYR